MVERYEKPLELYGMPIDLRAIKNPVLKGTLEIMIKEEEPQTIYCMHCWGHLV